MDHPFQPLRTRRHAGAHGCWPPSAGRRRAAAVVSGGAVATPAIGRDLHGGTVAMNWITNAFMLAFGSFLMAAGALADQFGRKRLFAIGVGGFTLMRARLRSRRRCSRSTCCAPRARGGRGARGRPAALAQEFDAARTRAFSLLGTTFGIGRVRAGLAGALIGQYGWRAIFVTGAVAGGLSLVFGLPRMHESRDPHATPTGSARPRSPPR